MNHLKLYNCVQTNDSASTTLWLYHIDVNETPGKKATKEG